MPGVGKGTGFGKVILFGEHFVVYGLPAIASAIGDTTVAEISPAKKYALIDDRPATEGYKKTKKDEISRSMKLLLEFMKIDVKKNPVEIRLSGNLFCTSGIGASAAMATAIARAFSDFYVLNLDDEHVNRISYEAEKGSAGTPSGIDNTCATYGGLLWFVKDITGAGKNVMEHIKIKRPLEIVLGSTGISQETKGIVDDVRKQKEKDPVKYGRLFLDYVKLAKEAKKALEGGDSGRLGELMDQNQQLLQEMKLSCNEADEIIAAAKGAGAKGAKITGTGRGGYVICLTPGKALQDKVAKAIGDKGYRTLKTTIG
jgi:mevalonate kinase